jgi:tripartite-type tricarboxylate transporter receptor subunit TctC
MTWRPTRKTIALLVGAFWMATSPAISQTFPSRPITIIVPSGAGGMDTMVRLIGPALETLLGQPVIIDNKPGANGVIGVQNLKRAEPDGHTLLFATTSILAVNPFVLKSTPYNSLDDFEPVARHVMLPLVWAANPSKGFKSLPDVVAYARANPGKVTMGFGGVGSFPHLLQEAFVRKNGIQALLVPYRSAPEADMGAVSGVVDIAIDNLSTILLDGGPVGALCRYRLVRLHGPKRHAEANC